MPGDARRAVTRASAIGAGVATVLFSFSLLRSGRGFFDPTFLGGFHDEQVRAWFDGRWAGSADSFPLERIVVDGEYHMYFGPWPSLLRLPVLAVTDALDGGLTRLSLLLAHVVLFAAVVRVVGQVRALHRTDRPDRRESICLAVFVFAVGSASSVLFTSAAIWVYDEALLWGAAWALWSISVLLDHLERPSAGRLVWITVTATLAMLTRPTAGALALVPLAVIAGVQLAEALPIDRLRRISRRIRPVAGLADEVAERRPGPTVVAAAVPVLAMVAVNLVRFGVLFDIPFENQDQLRDDPRRAAVLAQSGGGLADIRHLPTNLVHYLRPDAVGIEGTFPWVTFADPPAVLGDVARDPEGLSTSVTVSTTALVVLAVAGLVVVCRRRLIERFGLGEVARLRLPLAGAVIALIPTLVFPAISERYKVDATVLLVVAGAVGLATVLAVIEERPSWSPTILSGLALLLACNIWVQWSLTTVFQGAYRPFLDPGLRGDRIEDRLAVTAALGLGGRVGVVSVGADGQAPSERASIGTFATDPVCEVVFVSDGQAWLRVDVDDPAAFCRLLE